MFSFFVLFGKFQFTCDLNYAENQEKTTNISIFTVSGILIQCGQNALPAKLARISHIVLKLTQDETMIRLLCAFTSGTSKVHSTTKHLNQVQAYRHGILLRKTAKFWFCKRQCRPVFIIKSEHKGSRTVSIANYPDYHFKIQFLRKSKIFGVSYRNKSIFSKLHFNFH